MSTEYMTLMGFARDGHAAYEIGFCRPCADTGTVCDGCNVITSDPDEWDFDIDPISVDDELSHCLTIWDDIPVRLCADCAAPDWTPNNPTVAPLPFTGNPGIGGCVECGRHATAAQS